MSVPTGWHSWWHVARSLLWKSRHIHGSFCWISPGNIRTCSFLNEILISYRLGATGGLSSCFAGYPVFSFFSQTLDGRSTWGLRSVVPSIRACGSFAVGFCRLFRSSCSTRRAQIGTVWSRESRWIVIHAGGIPSTSHASSTWSIQRISYELVIEWVDFTFLLFIYQRWQFVCQKQSADHFNRAFWFLKYKSISHSQHYRALNFFPIYLLHKFTYATLQIAQTVEWPKAISETRGSNEWRCN